MNDKWDRLLAACRGPLSELRPYHASELCLAWGGLARWGLRKETLELAATDTSVPASIRNMWRPPEQVPICHGACWIAFVTDHPQSTPLLRETFVAPLRWVAADPRAHGDDDHVGERLPTNLSDLAESVLRELQTVPQVSARTWKLAPAAELGDVGLRGLELRCESGWASLAAGLLAAAQGGKPDPRVWATGGWTEGAGVAPVGKDTLAAKLALAQEMGARRFFVPASQEPLALALVAHLQNAEVPDAALQIGRLEEGEPDPTTALGAYLQDLDLPPAAGESRDVRSRYYLRQTNDARAKQYYRENLLADIIENCRALAETNGLLANLTHLVTIASDNPELAPLGIGVLRPRQCLIFCTEGYKDRTAAARRLARENRVGCHVVEHISESAAAMLRDMDAVIPRFLAGVAPENVVLDLTPGTKEMTLKLALEAARPGTRLFYLRQTREGAKVVPFSERPQMWISGKGALAKIGDS